MFIPTIVLSVLLAAAFLGSAGAKLAAAEHSIEIRCTPTTSSDQACRSRGRSPFKRRHVEGQVSLLFGV